MNHRPAPLVLVAVLLAANGAAMLVVPQLWYIEVPGVTLTGPYNPHFIRDVGATYIAIAAAFLWTALRPQAAPAAVIGAGWLLAHALIHLHDAAFCGRPPLGELARDFPGVYVPAIVATWLARRALSRAGGEPA